MRERGEREKQRNKETKREIAKRENWRERESRLERETGREIER